MSNTLNLSKVAAYHPEELQGIYDQLISKRMKMDLEFSDFLRENEFTMGEDVHTEIWDTYRRMNKSYTEVKEAIIQCTYYMEKN